MRQFILNNFKMRHINSLRKIKWAILKPFINDQNIIQKFYQKELEIKVLEYLLPMLLKKEFSVVMDIGANIGAYSYYLSKFIKNNKGICIGFEPRTDIYYRLIKNIKDSNFIGEKLALSNKEGRAELFLPTSHGRSSLVYHPEFEGFGKEDVAIATLDSYVNAKDITNIVFLKIDVEGHELEMLKGGRGTIEKHKPLILCESEDRYLTVQGRSVNEVINFMTSMDYSTFVISKKHFEVRIIDTMLFSKKDNLENEYFYNYWFIPNSLEFDFFQRISKILIKISQ